MIALIILQQTKSMIYTFWFDSDYAKFDLLLSIPSHKKTPHNINDELQY
jgi:hypothetical protein